MTSTTQNIVILKFWCPTEQNLRVEDFVISSADSTKYLFLKTYLKIFRIILPKEKESKCKEYHFYRDTRMWPHCSEC